jgi:hypothetical protein
LKNLNILPELTKKYILERITQEEIMELYTGITVDKYSLEGSSFTSLFRDDKNPTCNYWYKEDKFGEVRLKLKDWNGSFDGDVFDVASRVTKISSKTGQGFKLLLHKIAYDFKIHKYSNLSKDALFERKKLNIFIESYIKRAELKVFKVIPRSWDNYDKKYWNDRYGINGEILKIGKVIPVYELEVEGKDGYLHKIYKYNSRDPAYAYYGGNIDGIVLWKIYLPLRKRGSNKFFSNYPFIQGLHMFQPARVGIITKSYKDVLCYKTFGIQAVAVPSETYLMNTDEFINIKSKCDIILTNFDYDATGVVLANKYKRVYNCQPLMFTKGKYNQPDFGAKDFTDFRDTYGREKTKNLIENLIDQYYEELQAINKYNYNSLQWIQ